VLARKTRWLVSAENNALAWHGPREVAAGGGQDLRAVRGGVRALTATAAQVSDMLAGLAIIITLARLFGVLFRRLGQPPVVGEILAGVVLGPTFFGAGLAEHLFPAVQVRPALGGLANVGLVLFMFVVGYELDTSLMRSQGRAAVAVSFCSIIVPLGLGTALGFWLAGQQHFARHLPFALFVGVAMSTTAFPVLARILTDRGMQRTRLGNLALSSAAIGDVTAWIMLAIVLVIAKSSAASQWRILLVIPYVLVMFLAVRPLLRWLGDRRNKAGRLTPDILAVILVGLILSGYATQWMGLHYIFGAFLFGVLMPRAEAQQMRHEILERLEQVSVLLLLPVYFVMAGLTVNLSAFGTQSAKDLALILAAAIIGKFAGTYLGGRLQGIRSRQAGALATLMNTRGLTEIVILTVGLQIGLLNVAIYSLMVVMALVTTAMTGPVMQLVYPKRLVDRDIAEADRAALGQAPAYRVLVAASGAASDTAVMVVAAALGRGHSEPELVVSRLLPYRTPRLEVGTGLSGELVEMTQAMTQLDALAAPWRVQGVAVSELARFSPDPGADLIAQLEVASAALLVISEDHPDYARIAEQVRVRMVSVAGATPLSWPAVLVRSGRGPGAMAAVEVGALLAAAQSARLVLDAGPRPGKRLSQFVSDLGQSGIDLTEGEDAGTGALVVAADGASDDAHIVVRAEPRSADQEPAVLMPAAAPQG
jgi:Kef-type K+ transport system membrane component KefB